LRELTINCLIEAGVTVFIALNNFSNICGLPNIGFVSFFILNFSKKYLFLVEIPIFCSNIEILDYRELLIIFATKTDNSMAPKMAKLSIIDNDNIRYINTNVYSTTFVLNQGFVFRVLYP
jgi:hypothetical protein